MLYCANSSGGTERKELSGIRKLAKDRQKIELTIN
jgi:hypothetical protein